MVGGRMVVSGSAALAVLWLVMGGCGNGSPSARKATGVGEVSLELRAPEAFAEPFCVGIEASGADFSPPVSSEASYPAGTIVIETVLPNIPAGPDRVVELGIFKDGECATPLADADWYGRAEGVTIVEGDVTLVNLILEANQGGGGNTGSVVIRGTGQNMRRLHGEVVDPQSTPIAGALCRVFDGTALVASTVSGSTAPQLGVIDTTVNVPASVNQLRVVCASASGAQGVDISDWVPDPADPTLGTFPTTVILKPRVQVLESTPERLLFRVNLSSLPLQTVQTPAGEFQQIVRNRMDPGLSLNGGDLPTQEPGTPPEIPTQTVLFAVPVDGGNAEVVSVLPEGEGDSLAARLYPAQPFEATPGSPTPGGSEPEEGDGAPFQFDEKSYLSRASKAGELLDLEEAGLPFENIQQVTLATVDYDPQRRILTQYESLLVEIKLNPGERGPCFRIRHIADNFSLDPIDRRIATTTVSPVLASAINQNALQRICPVVIKPIFLGARFIIVTPPAFRAAADDLAAHKRARGISTFVVETTAIQPAGVISASDIRSYLFNALFNWFVKPKWVLLMADVEDDAGNTLIPTHYSAVSSYDSAKNAGDQYFGQFIVDDTVVPVFGIGRFPVDTLAQAQDMVDKVKAYEASPPSGIVNPFYNRMTFAAQFQDNSPQDGIANRWFAETSEDIRDYQVATGRSVERIYSAPSATPPTGSIMRWNSGAAVPWYLQKPLFPWTGSTTDIINAINDGTPIVYHRDHGWWSGWGTPGFSTGNINNVNVANREFPVVFSINCASGIFDNETVDDPVNIVGGGYGPGQTSVYWGERFVREPNDGALAVIGDTRSSSTVLNNDMAKGLFDAMFPGYLPFGSATAKRRLGDVLNHAKCYVKSQGYSAAATGQEMKIYNLLGDPTVEPWLASPFSILVPGIFAELGKVQLNLDPEPCSNCPPELRRVPNIAGTVVVARPITDNGPGPVIARTLADGQGSAVLNLDPKFRGKLEISLSKAGQAVPRTVMVEVAPGVR